MLPYDYARCKPEISDIKCLDCQRYADHPDQTWGARTPVTHIVSPSHETCRYIPIQKEDGK